MPISVPSLEARREDITMLAQHFISELNSAQGLPVRPLADETETLLQTMAWPGNVRQLRNVIERVLILGPENGKIDATEISGGEVGVGENVVSPNSYATLPLREAREMFEREYLMAQINRFGGNISRTANFVGMERSALHRKLKTLNVVTTNKAGTRIAKIEDAVQYIEDA